VNGRDLAGACRAELAGAYAEVARACPRGRHPTAVQVLATLRRRAARCRGVPLVTLDRACAALGLTLRDHLKTPETP
jgi:hypothetical protein